MPDAPRRIQTSREWYGNWCWNAFWFQNQIARQFLVWLHGRKLFNCESGEARLFSLWKWDEPLPLEPDKTWTIGLGSRLAKGMVAGDG